jgi:hypothetical protein
VIEAMVPIPEGIRPTPTRSVYTIKDPVLQEGTDKKKIVKARAINDGHLGSFPDTHTVAMWMAHPQLDTLRSLNSPFISARLSVAESRYLRKALVSVRSKLLAGASRMWQTRCKQFTTSISGFATMTSYRVTPGSVQPSINSVFSSQRSAGGLLASLRDPEPPDILPNRTYRVP